MTRTIFTCIVGAGLLACSSTTRIHMEEVEVNGGAAGEASTSTAGDAANTGGSSSDADSAAKESGTTGAK